MAVTIDHPADGRSLAAVMKKMSGSINLSSLGVRVLTTRKTRQDEFFSKWKELIRLPCYPSGEDPGGDRGHS